MSRYMMRDFDSFMRQSNSDKRLVYLALTFHMITESMKDVQNKFNPACIILVHVDSFSSLIILKFYHIPNKLLEANPHEPAQMKSTQKTHHFSISLLSSVMWNIFRCLIWFEVEPPCFLITLSFGQSWQTNSSSFSPLRNNVLMGALDTPFVIMLTGPSVMSCNRASLQYTIKWDRLTTTIKRCTSHIWPFDLNIVLKQT